MTQPEPNPIAACTISRDVQNFDLLIEDMEAVLGENWGDLGFDDALMFFDQPDSDSLEFIAIAIDGNDEIQIDLLGKIIKRANEKDINVILIAEEVSPTILHQLLRGGADEFVPYPLPENELKAAIERLKQPKFEAVQQAGVPAHGSTGQEAVLLAVHGIAGGTGATTFAVNLAWELAIVDKKDPPRVCILDFDLQTGSVSTYLDLPRRDMVYEMWSETESVDSEVFRQALVSHEEKLWALTAPSDMLPLDLISSEDVTRVLALARQQFDYVIVDMPSTVVPWTETVLSASQIYFTTIEMDMRSAQNALRFKRVLKSEELPVEKLRFCLNRAPKFTDLNGKSRIKRMSESLEIGIEVQLPDGGSAVSDCGDHGAPLASSAKKNPLRKEIAKLAFSLHELGQSEIEAA
jgi:pilus assembly protein CpaE